MDDKLKEIRSDSDFSKSKEVAQGLAEKYNVDLVKLFELLSEHEVLIPLSIWNDRLSALETVARYLHENLGLSFKRIAELMNRSEKTVWQAYNFSLRKLDRRLVVVEPTYLVPLSVFADRKFSNLESVVLFAKEQYNLRFSELGSILHRDQRTVWTVYNRALKKRSA
jgi:transcription initiation factor TFIIIB Brf1 subunit/transcription initiation factor TFIIB